MIIKGKRYIYR